LRFGNIDFVFGSIVQYDLPSSWMNFFWLSDLSFEQTFFVIE